MGLSAPSSRGLLPTNLTLFSCLLHLPISLSMELLLTAGELGATAFLLSWSAIYAISPRIGRVRASE